MTEQLANLLQWSWLIFLGAFGWVFKLMHARVIESEKMINKLDKDVAVMKESHPTTDEVREIVKELESKIEQSQDKIFSKLEELNTGMAKLGALDRRNP